MPELGFFLETFAGGQLRRYPVTTLPFRVGRTLGLELVLPSESVSKVHAEIYAAGAGLRVRDLGSRNGTFVNQTPVQDAPLAEGDVLHFADFELRVGRSERAALAHRSDLVSTADCAPPPGPFVEEACELRELIERGQVTVAFQPIVQLSNGAVVAHEALGRGRRPGLPEEPRELLTIAETINAGAELSRLFRRKAAELARERPHLRRIFLNTHPVEFVRPGLLESLEELRAAAPGLELALEIHESALTSVAAIVDLRSRLAERGIALVYDNFGAGQARLLEIAQAPPQYLKFHRRFVKDLHRASAGKQRLLQSLIALAEKLHAGTVAESVETDAEARACKEIGFTFGQGTHFGRPKTIEEG